MSSTYDDCCGFYPGYIFDADASGVASLPRNWTNPYFKLSLAALIQLFWSARSASVAGTLTYENTVTSGVETITTSSTITTGTTVTVNSSSPSRRTGLLASYGFGSGPFGFQCGAGSGTITTVGGSSAGVVPFSRSNCIGAHFFDTLWDYVRALASITPFTGSALLPFDTYIPQCLARDAEGNYYFLFSISIYVPTGTYEAGSFILLFSRNMYSGSGLSFAFVMNATVVIGSETIEIPLYTLSPLVGTISGSLTITFNDFYSP